MHRGVPSSRSRVSGSVASVSSRQSGVELTALNSRFERLLKRVRLLSQHCNRVPNGLRQELKQFLDLAVIELEEGYQTLVSYQGSVPLCDGSPSSLPHELSPRQVSENEQVELERESVAADLQPVADSPDCDQRNDSALDPIELSFDTMAKLAEIPEAADLTAILARLENGGDASEADDFEKPMEPLQSNTRERLLGFEVCRMETAPELAECLPETAAEVQLADGLSLPPSPVELPEGVLPSGDDTGSSLPGNEQLVVDQSEASANEVESGQVASCSVESTVIEPAVPAAESAVEPAFSPASPQPVQGQTPTAPQKRPKEQVENVNPLDAIGAENLQAILALKEELEQVSAKFKKSDAG